MSKKARLVYYEIYIIIRKQPEQESLGQVNEINSNTERNRGARSESPGGHGTRRRVVVRAVRSPSPATKGCTSKVKTTQCHEKSQVKLYSRYSYSQQRLF